MAWFYWKMSSHNKWIAVLDSQYPAKTPARPAPKIAFPAIEVPSDSKLDDLMKQYPIDYQKVTTDNAEHQD